MTPSDALIVAGLMAAAIGFLFAVLAFVAIASRLLTRAWTAGVDAGQRHIDTCITQALQIPFYGSSLEDEHRRLIENETR